MNPYLTLGRGMRIQLVIGVAPKHQLVPWGPSQKLEPKLAQGGHNPQRGHHLNPAINKG